MSQLRTNVQALKGKTKKVEDHPINLKMQSDVVANHLDYCINTSATIKIDGFGCPLLILTKKQKPLKRELLFFGAFFVYKH